MTARQWLGVALLVLAYALLWPGLTEPMLTLNGTVERADLVRIGRQILNEGTDLPRFLRDLVDRFVDTIDARGTIPAFSKTNSILGTATDLYRNGHVPVAALIVVFSVIVPALKAIVLILAQLPVVARARSSLLRIALATSKWSMADVFVIAIFIAYLAGRGMQQGDSLVDFKTELGVGFWFFLAYCLVSIAGTQLLCSASPKRASADE